MIGTKVMIARESRLQRHVHMLQYVIRPGAERGRLHRQPVEDDRAVVDPSLSGELGRARAQRRANVAVHVLSVGTAVVGSLIIISLGVGFFQAEIGSEVLALYKKQLYWGVS